MVENSTMHEFCNIVKTGNEEVKKLLNSCTSHIKIDQIVVPSKEGEGLFSGNVGDYKNENGYKFTT